MIPKIIHYCWFGGAPLLPLAEQYLASWKEHMQDAANGGEWKYMRWDESNFDISSAPLYVQQAYEARKFAFVSDYVRLWALDQFDGVYFDTDVMVLKSYSIHYFAGSWVDGKKSGGWRDWLITREIVNALVQVKRKLRGTERG